MEMNEQEMMAALAELEAELERWRAESSDPHTLIACKDAIRCIRYVYESIKELT